MAWIESHQGLERHPKIMQLGYIMNWSIDETLGRMHRFWWWCLDYAPTGDLRQVDWKILGMHLGLKEDDSLKFREALVTTHLVCRLARTRLPLRVHDWIEYAGRYLRDTRFKRHPEKMAEVIELYAIKCQPTVSRQAADKQPTCQPTVRRQSAVPNQPNQPNQPTNQPEEGNSRALVSFHAGSVVTRWNQIPGVKVCKSAEGKLAKRLTTLLSEKNEAWWDSFFAEVRKSKFLTGQIPPTNGRRIFRADLFWATGPENLSKIVSGKYDDDGEQSFDQYEQSAKEFLERRSCEA